jgi:hypothetical protein
MTFGNMRSGGKDRLGCITKQGDRYLRSLFTTRGDPLCGRLRAARSTDHQAARDQDRHVMRDFWLHSVGGSIMRFVYKPRE